MCGIAGLYFFNDYARTKPNGLSNAMVSLHWRGPDSRGTYAGGNVCLGHTRLSIIDTSAAASQPFSDACARYTLVYNGEIYNFRKLREQLKQKQVPFRSESDTEVLLQWLIENGPEGIKDLQGFFAFAFYDKKEDTLLLARDRFGIKPLYYHQNGDKFVFASEMKAMMAMEVPRIIDRSSLLAYLHLNYIPGPWSIFEKVFKLLPGNYMQVSRKEIITKEYYRIDPSGISEAPIPDYSAAQVILQQKLTESVQKRLVADVPLGAFLSGGIDSSIITALAAREVKGLNTFSIGFKDEPMFDETHFARAVAKMHKTNHTEFKLSTDDLLGCVFDVLGYTDEPFADSSALAVYILSKETRKKVTVALSGDGADELFAGYYKHMAEWRVRHPNFAAHLLKHFQPLLSVMPQSRSNFFLNKIRQFNRFGSGMRLEAKARYWQWAGFSNQEELARLLHFDTNETELTQRKAHWLKNIQDDGNIGQVFLKDMQLVLPYDMLTKVDMMSMANSLEVRVPFLDHDLVNFVFSLPDHYKIDGKRRKKILRDTFRKDLPPELYNRNKQGFEVPLLRWFNNELKSLIEEDLLSETFINQQRIFNYNEIRHLLNQLFSKNPGETPARIWALIVFQFWWKKNMI